MNDRPHTCSAPAILNLGTTCSRSENEQLRHDDARSQPRLANARGAGRHRRMLYTVFLPEQDSPTDESGVRPRQEKARPRAKRRS
jgi:hypothetical protein